MSARSLVVDALNAALDSDVVVIPYARNLDAILGPTVMVRIDSVTPSTQPQAWHLYEMSLCVVTALQDSLAAEAELDDLLLDVLFAVDQSDLPTWTVARRATFDDTLHGYEVVLTVPVTKE